MLGPRLKTKALKEERDLVFLIAQVKFDPSVELHLRALQTCYFALLDELFMSSPCPAEGSHWEKIGFQVASFLVLPFIIHLFNVFARHRLYSCSHFRYATCLSITITTGYGPLH
jgi:hypothetical protein